MNRQDKQSQQESKRSREEKNEKQLQLIKKKRDDSSRDKKLDIISKNNSSKGERGKTSERIHIRIVARKTLQVMKKASRTRVALTKRAPMKKKKLLRSKDMES
jgi:hypothetical protein